MLNLTRLQLFHELSVLGTISAVAQSLGLTRPAVSQQLALLERETGAVLFERSVRGARLTPAGRRLLARVSPLFELVNDIEAELLDATKVVSGEVRVAAFGSVATTIVPSAIAALLKAHSALDITFNELEPSEGLKAVAAKQVDLAVVDDLTSADAFVTSLEFHPLCIDQFGAVISADHKLAMSGKKTIELTELAHELWALNQSATSYQAFLINACCAVGFSPRVRCNCRNIAATLEAVRTGYFVTVLPSLAIRAIVEDPDFHVLPVQPILGRRIFVAIQKGNARKPVVAAVLTALERASLQYSSPCW